MNRFEPDCDCCCIVTLLFRRSSGQTPATCLFMVAKLLSVACILWNLSTALVAASRQFWQAAILRVGQGIGEAACNPFATSILRDHFGAELIGSAIGEPLTSAVMRRLREYPSVETSLWQLAMPGSLQSQQGSLAGSSTAARMPSVPQCSLVSLTRLS